MRAIDVLENHYELYVDDPDVHAACMKSTLSVLQCVVSSEIVSLNQEPHDNPCFP